MPDNIYTHDEAAILVDAIEKVLLENNIRVPSPEDDERDNDDAGFYGSVYSDLLDYFEERIISIVERSKEGAGVVEGEFSGDY